MSYISSRRPSYGVWSGYQSIQSSPTQWSSNTQHQYGNNYVCYGYQHGYCSNQSQIVVRRLHNDGGGCENEGSEN